MPSLKDLKTRINSVKSTQKITSAMKMVAAAKLRRAQDSAEKGRPYADRMQQIINSLAAKADPASAPQLLVGNGRDKNASSGGDLRRSRSVRRLQRRDHAADPQRSGPSSR